MMVIRPFCQGEDQKALDFLLPREERAIGLAATLTPDSPLRKTVVCASCLEEGSSVMGLLVLLANGILFHLCELKDSPQIRYSLQTWLTGKTVRCIIGEASFSQVLQACLPAPLRVVDYELMTVCTARQANPVSQGIHIRLCDEKDAQSLLDLQEGYEREEVIPPGEAYHRTACLAALSLTLSRQIVLAAFSSSVAIAKAGTNARGFNWDQIGGVYTDPKWRRKGLSEALIRGLVCDRLHAGRKVALFVKPENHAARSLYTKIGFSPVSPFRIVYY